MMDKSQHLEQWDLDSDELIAIMQNYKYLNKKQLKLGSTLNYD